MHSRGWEIYRPRAVLQSAAGHTDDAVSLRDTDSAGCAREEAGSNPSVDQPGSEHGQSTGCCAWAWWSRHSWWGTAGTRGSGSCVSTIANQGTNAAGCLSEGDNARYASTDY